MKVSAVLLFLAGTAVAEPTLAELAAKENTAGINAIFAKDYAGATKHFLAATSGDPQAKYYFNLCTSLYQEGTFGAAVRACEQAIKMQPPAALLAKTRTLLETIKADAAAQHISLQPVEVSPTEAAASLARDGRAAMTAGRAADAATNFRDAISKDPVAGYIFDLCLADYQLSRFDEALTACTAVGKHQPAPALRAKADKWIVKIKADANAQHLPLGPTPEPASAADFAWQSDAQGIELMTGQRFEDARVKFRDAVARDPQARYFLDLCTANYQLGKYSEALDACNGVAQNRGTPELKTRADKLMTKIREDAKTKGVSLAP